ncbi:LIMR family protein SELMODRAFT_432210-like [Selaginella moellendorffii]|uniref:LIMR family protein SELMODRAFT_432210-like n=1 Tax=Selaginella moellendorffii TaxID=88036 RepID=UPI000D1C26C5|nr:LIMR family protein SELMODRAFT_432210-like [Selaginella moellendorffii]|eukprot:XP_024523586.1 LIMR family protein SELMODRAFT_432210-like [Selaginella moellendorffii]
MKQLWWVVYIIDTVLVYLVIPFRDLLLRERPGEDCDTKGKERPLVGGDTPHSLLPPLGNSLSVQLIRLDLWLKLRGLCVFPTYVIALSILFTEATDLAKSSNVLKKVTLGLQREERGGKKGRKLRKNVKKVQQELVFLEDDVQALNAGREDLLGTTPFAIFCYYFVMSVISGEMHLGMKLLFLSIHPMK